MSRDLSEFLNERDPFWPHPLTVEVTGFKNKALGAFHANLAVGCSHGCRFCYVTSVSVAKLAKQLREHGVSHPVSEWGNYLLPRVWDEPTFRKSLQHAMAIPHSELLPDGHRAVFYCSTTDPFQISRHRDPRVRKLHQAQMELLFRRSLEIIRDESDLRIRILTRSPLAAKHFGLMKSLGDRLLFGMSVPSLDDALVRCYEPNAPGVMKRLECMRKAKEAGLHVYVAVAPTYPEMGLDDYREIHTMIKSLDPVTVYHEPINVRGGNVDLMENEFHKLGLEFRSDIFRNTENWAVYATQALRDFEAAAGEVGFSDQLKLWPDGDLMGESAIQAVVDAGIFKNALEMAEWIKNQWERPVVWPGVTSKAREVAGEL